MTFAFEIYSQGAHAPPVTSANAPLVTAELVYVNADPATMKPAALPEELRQRIIGFERVSPQA